MFKKYLNNAWSQMRENRLLSFISIAGTALAIAMIMVMVIVERVKTEPFAPEVNRDRTLYVKFMAMNNKGNGGKGSAAMSAKIAKEGFKALTTAEAVTVFNCPIFGSSSLASVPGGSLVKVDIAAADADFFKVFEYQFESGAPFTEADVESSLPRAVVCETVARKLFGSTDVVGRSFQLDYKDYTVSGVIADVSKLATMAYAQVIVPHTTIPVTLDGLGEYTALGMKSVAILARSPKDFPAIREEAERLRVKYNESVPNKDITVDYLDQPDDQATMVNRIASDTGPTMWRIRLQMIIVIALLLLVPAINLSGLTLSRMRKRYPELGVRRSFGATRSELLMQILSENFVLSIIGGMVGLVLSWGALLLWENIWTGGIEAVIGPSMLFDPMVFGITFVFCLCLNLLSAGIPAWRASRLNIVNALNA